MKATITKTIALTLAGIVCVCAIVYGILAIWFPVVIGDIAEKMGNYNVSITYYEKQYKKTNDINDLYFLVTKLDATNDYVKTEHYSKTLLKDANFDKLVEEKDKTLEGDVIKTREYVSGKYVVSAYKVSPFEDIVIKFCEDYVKQYKYANNNAYTSLINGRQKDFTLEELKIIKAKLDEKSYYSQPYYDNLKNDKAVIDKLIEAKTPKE